ncbi:saccharopine dehydrogenase family protein [Rhizohabitans arisaemae]|uniref:saccharopine dehydrogenase family protein n=1 Tax=Rhizohabitans arisaemae TaxID=2720610 RepID=UPI0024B234D9|nr:saccharopine dehydrogenase NADP-binding domain-containing protein [Rhizohabitans arisaemae]
MASTSSPRIVLFGATGYTGRLTAEALVELEAHPILAGRDLGRLEALAASLPGNPDTAVADVRRPATVRRLLSEGDVIVSTVGPFTRWGEPAVEAAIESKAIYLDSTGEPTFIRRIFQRYGPRAASSGTALITAFGYDYVPGNLAACMALEEAGPSAERVDIGYFIRGNVAGRTSAGTKASAVGMILEPMFGYRGGRITREHGRTRAFSIDGKRRHGLSIGASEHFTLPRRYPGLQEVGVYLGWLGPLTRVAGVVAKATPVIAALPGAKWVTEKAAARALKGAPPSAEPSPITTQVVAEAFDSSGKQLTRVELTGGDPYDFTGRMLAWAAITAANRGVQGVGSLGPVDAFGLDGLTAGCARAGLVRLDKD